MLNKKIEDMENAQQDLEKQLRKALFFTIFVNLSQFLLFCCCIISCF